MGRDKIKTTDIKNLTPIKEIIQDSALIDEVFFKTVADDNFELADFLIKPAMDYLGIKDYQIKSVKTEVSEDFLKQHGVRLDLLIQYQDGTQAIVEVQNEHSERMPLKRLRYIKSSHDLHILREGDDYENLPEVIVICYTRKPLKELNNGSPVAIIKPVDIVTGQAVPEGWIEFIINNKYKDEKFKAFTEVIEDLVKSDMDEIVNPIVRDIHKRIKIIEKGDRLVSKFNDCIQEYYRAIDKVFEEKEKIRDKEIEEEYKEKNKIRDKELKKKDKVIEDKDREILRLKKQLADNGILID